MKSRRIFDPWGVVFGLAVPLVAAVAGLVLTAAWDARLPAEIITHWGTEGPDGWSPPTTASWVYALAIVFVGAGCASFAALAQGLLMMRRILLIVGLTVTGLLAVLQITTLWIQLDSTPRADIELPSETIGLGILFGFAVGALGAALLRDYRVRTPATVAPDPALPRGPAVEVHDTIGFSTVGVCVIYAVGIALAFLACATIDSNWPLWVALTVLALLIGAIRFDITVDERGVRVRNMGTTAIDLGIDEIVEAKVVQLSP
ncbi:MAG: DUF1648 domain-containing protein, partial [Aldersonia sp.]|nr:DUF1648 domain-containing protein [Aldersonia sp.]